MIISHKHKFIFFCPVGNCATTSVYKALLPFHDEEKVQRIYEFNFEHPLNKNPDGIIDPQEGVYKNHLIISKHITPKRFFSFNVFSSDEFKDYIKFCIVRNPWDWCLAVFLKAVRETGGSNFKNAFKFTEEHFLITLRMILGSKNFINTQYETVCNENGNPEVTNFLKFENLNNDFHEILHKVGLPNLHLEHEQNNNNKAQKKYRDYYTNQSRKMVQDQFSKDIENFNYIF